MMLCFIMPWGLLNPPTPSCSSVRIIPTGSLPRTFHTMAAGWCYWLAKARLVTRGWRTFTRLKSQNPERRRRALRKDLRQTTTLSVPTGDSSISKQASMPHGGGSLPLIRSMLRALTGRRSFHRDRMPWMSPMAALPW